MNCVGKSLMLAVIVSMLAVMPARAADDAADPGEQIKQGFISVGHGIRDGAVKAWGAVKSTFDGNSSGNNSEKKASRKKSSAATDQNQK